MLKAALDLSTLRRAGKPVFLAVGFFDGIHKGHKNVIRTAVAMARASGGEAWLLTFDEHPRSVLDRSGPKLLTSPEQRARLAAELGVKRCLVLPFTRRLAAMSGRAFAAELAACAPPLRSVVVGRNWRFGRGATAGPRELCRWLRNVEVAVVQPARRKDGRPISSTLVRSAVAAGRLREAAAMLGRPFSIAGRVVRGRNIGASLGYPTANLDTRNEALPPPGVYAVTAKLSRTGERVRVGVLYIGTRPTFGAAHSRRLAVELHLHGVQRNLYGKEIEVFFAGKLRDEKTFSSPAQLARQIGRDVLAAIRLLARRHARR